MARIDSFTTEGLITLVGQEVATATQDVTDNVAALLDQQTQDNTALLGSKAPTDPTFQINTVYQAGQLVVHDSRLFAAKADFTSGSVFNVGNWSYIGLPVVVADQEARDSLSPFDGFQVYRLDTHMLELYSNTMWVAINGPIVCTSATRPPGYAGMMIYETDTKLVYIYGTTWVMIKPGGPRGYVNSIYGGSGDKPSGTTIFLTLPFAAVSGRRYRITGYCSGSQITNIGGATRVHLYTNANGDNTNVFYYNTLGVNDTAVGTGALYLTAPATATYTVSMALLISASSFRLEANASYIQVEDIGV